MKAYIISVVIVGIIGSIIGILSPDGEGGGLKRQVKTVVGIAIIPVCIFPLISFAETLDGIDTEAIFGEVDEEKRQELESIFENEYFLAEEQNLREGIARLLLERFGIDSSECYIAVTVNTDGEGNRRLEQIYVELYGSAVWKDTGAIEKYLVELFSCRTVVAVG